MNIEHVKTMTPLQRFLYWVTERHNIYLKRLAGRPKPWTDDVILQTEFFTNPFREFDKTTVWLRENVRLPLTNRPEVLMATVIFRWFNLISTGELLLKHDLFVKWDSKKATEILLDYWDDGNNPVFTNAYIIKAGNGPRGCKIPNVCKAIGAVWEEQDRLVTLCLESRSMQTVWKALKKFYGIGGFNGYELVCDFRWTYLLKDATDKDTWCNVGPGAKRGMNWILEKDLDILIPSDVWCTKTKELLDKLKGLKLKNAPVPEMREVEHSLCEYDKYSRVLFGTGRSKRSYDGW